MLSRIRYMAMAIGLPLTVALAAQAPAPSSARQTPSATFRAEVSYVEINARVIDRDGNFVQDVKQEDVQVLEDGKPQAVTTFGLVDLPFVPLERPAYLDPSVVRIEPDVASNRSALDGRLYVIVVDDFHISPQRTSRAREVARRFIVERLDANDRASIVVTSGDANGSQEFTANRRLLLEAVDSIVGRKLPSAAEAKADEFAREQIAAQSPGDDTRDPLFRMRTPVDMDEGKRNYQARAAMSVLRGIGEWMASVQGRRKSIVYISEGFDYDLADVFVEATLRDPNSFFSGSGGGSQAGLLSAEAKNAIDTATRNNVTIYVLDPRGLTTASMDAELGGVPTGSATTTALEQRSVGLGQELLGSQMTLRHIATETGGFAAINTNDFSDAIARISEENSSYYVLGYVSNNAARDGRIRAIAVNVPSRDVRVIHRARYAAPRKDDVAGENKPSPSADRDAAARWLFDALGSPLPSPGLPMTAAVLPYRSTANRANLDVFIQIAGGSIGFEQRGGTFNSVLSWSVGVYDASGKSVVAKPEISSIELKLTPDMHDRVMRTGVRVWKRVEVPAGRTYQVRAAAREGSGANGGSVSFDLDVPELSEDMLAMSGIALASSADASMVAFRNPLEGTLPAAPTLLREFPSGSELAVSAEISGGPVKPPHPVNMTATVRADDGRIVFTAAEERSSAGPGRGTVYGVRIPMRAWPPGIYVLTLQAVSTVAGVNPVSSDIPFTVR